MAIFRYSTISPFHHITRVCSHSSFIHFIICDTLCMTNSLPKSPWGIFSQKLRKDPCSYLQAGTRHNVIDQLVITGNTPRLFFIIPLIVDTLFGIDRRTVRFTNQVLLFPYQVLFSGTDYKRGFKFTWCNLRTRNNNRGLHSGSDNKKKFIWPIIKHRCL